MDRSWSDMGRCRRLPLLVVVVWISGGFLSVELRVLIGTEILFFFLTWYLVFGGKGFPGHSWDGELVLLSKVLYGVR